MRTLFDFRKEQSSALKSRINDLTSDISKSAIRPINKRFASFLRFLFVARNRAVLREQLLDFVR